MVVLAKMKLIHDDSPIYYVFCVCVCVLLMLGLRCVLGWRDGGDTWFVLRWDGMVLSVLCSAVPRCAVLC